MTKETTEYADGSQIEKDETDLPLDKSEIEVRLAIAEFVIRRVAGTPAGREIFNGLIKRFENRYPHHKLLAHYLTSPEHFEADSDDIY